MGEINIPFKSGVVSAGARSNSLAHTLLPAAPERGFHEAVEAPRPGHPPERGETEAEAEAGAHLSASPSPEGSQ
ncbi:hypothetical protein OsI_24408 [Oryza sativa Indica Group]|jgi:hypothetical protein|uniref:Uncharacterized protein n=1 Tax=Oryza sativa subsp. indica TaxID=39946 RepID=B8B280_ORYSI|nr:hypothetical protein OsI_24408 [Oryza sativa Indica Group]